MYSPLVSVHAEGNILDVNDLVSKQKNFRNDGTLTRFPIAFCTRNESFAHTPSKNRLQHVVRIQHTHSHTVRSLVVCVWTRGMHWMHTTHDRLVTDCLLHVINKRTNRDTEFNNLHITRAVLSNQKIISNKAKCRFVKDACGIVSWIF